MGISEFVEMNFLRKRMKLLMHKIELGYDEQLSRYLECDFTLKEVNDINNVMINAKRDKIRLWQGIIIRYLLQCRMI